MSAPPPCRRRMLQLCASAFQHLGACIQASSTHSSSLFPLDCLRLRCLRGHLPTDTNTHNVKLARVPVHACKGFVTISNQTAPLISNDLTKSFMASSFDVEIVMAPRGTLPSCSGMAAGRPSRVRVPPLLRETVGRAASAMMLVTWTSIYRSY